MDGPGPAPRPVRFSRLLGVFAWTGLTSLGGGRSAYFHDAMVVRRPWLDSREFVQDLTLSQLLPGPNFSNLAVILGHRLGGLRGAAAAGLAVLIPGAVALLALAALYFRTGLDPRFRPFLHGMGAAVVGLVLVAVIRVAGGAVRAPRAGVVAALAFLGVGPLRVNTALVILLAGTLSLWLQRPPPGARSGR